MPHITCVILAAGKGTRMKSEIPKVMHPLAGKPMIDHVLDKVERLGINDIITVLGHGRDVVADYIKERTRIVIQEEQLGTGHALMQVAPYLDEDSAILVLSGDQPLLSYETLQSLLEVHEKTASAATVLTAVMDNPFGYGRVIKSQNRFEKIVEEKDADADQKRISEINTGTYCFQAAALKKALGNISCRNAQGEYYLTDVFNILLSFGLKIETFCTADCQEALGINDRCQLAEAETILQERIRKKWMREGVTIINPASVLIDIQVKLERDVIIHPFTILKGNTTIGEGSIIGPSTVIENCLCQAGCRIENSVLREATIGENCLIGPFAYIRPGSILSKGVKIGDFVEIKKSLIGESSKVPHHSYIGDSILGKNVNIGAGTITCNYDGKNKNTTIIGDNAFIGSNTNFVAPVEVGKGAVVGAGSTITKDVPENALALERSEQKIINNWLKAKDK